MISKLSVLLVLCLICGVFAESQVFSGIMAPGVVSSGPLGVLPQGLAGVVVLEMSAPDPTQVCLEEDLELEASLTDCNPGGYFTFPAGNATATLALFELDGDSSPFFRHDEGAAAVNPNATTNIKTTTLRTGVHYFVNVAFFVNETFSNATFTLTVSYGDKVCMGNSVGLPDGLCAATLPVASNETTAVPLSANSTSYLQYEISRNSTSLSLTVLANVSEPTMAMAGLANGSMTILMRLGNSPTLQQYDAMAVWNGAPVSLTIDSPSHGIWYIGAMDNTNVSFTASITVVYAACPNMTFNPNCNSTYTNLTNSFSAQMFEGTGGYQYFALFNTSSIVVGTTTEDLEETAPSLFVSYHGFPNNQSYMLSAQGETTNYIYATASHNVDWKITVWANEGVEYYIWANTYCPNNCTGDDWENYSNSTTYGTCNSLTGVCQCTDGYGDFSCTSQGLATVWIVLIVIACVIVLAVAIGVPVACYIRNKRRTRYERV